MAKIEGTQNIPSEIAKQYSAILTPKLSSGTVRRRCPFQRPKTKDGGPCVTPAMEFQRSRFKTAVSKFNECPQESRSRWYETAPEWHSYLWYYNWFMLSALMGVTGIPGRYEAVIKGINHYTFTLPSGDPTNVTVSISAVDPERAIVFFYGAGAHAGEANGQYFGIPNYPYLVSLDSSQAIVKASLYNDQAAGCSISVIEYI